MAEQESVIGNILVQLQTVLDGITIPYNGEDHTVTCELQRRYRQPDGNYPYIEIMYNSAESVEDTTMSDLLNVNVAVSCYIGDVNDSDVDSDPISYQLRNVNAYIIKEIMTNPTLNGYALDTNYGAQGQFILEYTDAYDTTTSDVEFVNFVELTIKVFVDQDNPFTRTG